MLRAMLLTAILAFGLTHAASAATLHFHATLNGASEVPRTTSPVPASCWRH
jgi:hypothetical protein